MLNQAVVLEGLSGSVRSSSDNNPVWSQSGAKGLVSFRAQIRRCYPLAIPWLAISTFFFFHEEDCRVKYAPTLNGFVNRWKEKSVDWKFQSWQPSLILVEGVEKNHQESFSRIEDSRKLERRRKIFLLLKSISIFNWHVRYIRYIGFALLIEKKRIENGLQWACIISSKCWFTRYLVFLPKSTRCYWNTHSFLFFSH